MSEHAEQQELPDQGAPPDLEQPQTDATDQNPQQNADDNAPEPNAQTQPPQRRVDRRIGHLTARLDGERQARERAEQQLRDMQALLEAQRQGEGGTQAATPQPISDEELDRRADARLAAREYNAKRQSLIAAGTAAMGQAEWNEATSVLAGYRLTENQAFMQSIVEIDNGAEIVADLAQDHAAMERLATMPPHRIALELVKMSQKAPPSRSAPAGNANALSRAPAPSRASVGRTTVTPPDVYDPKMSMAEYAAERAKTAKYKLGGPRAPRR